MFGCESAPEKPAADATAQPAKPGAVPGATAKPDTAAAPGAGEAIPGTEKAGAEAGAAAAGTAGMKNTIYFDFDRFEIKPEFRETVLAHAAYLAKNPNAKVSIEGHCDERGTREYNIGLGDRRATAVRQLLKLQGVSDKQIATISFGEERPVAMGHDEDSWWQNRRAVFVYAGS
jgi:peptidoglycan-associated lipoprotein